MKSEERHELKENSLSAWLQFGLPMFLKKNGSYLLLAAALCLLGFSLWRRHEQSKVITQQTAANELLAAEGPMVQNRALKLQQIIDHYAEIKPIVALAYRDLGDYYLKIFAAGGPEEIPGSTPAPPINPNDALARAEDSFERVVREYPDQMLAAGSAKLGLAEVAIDKRDWAAARKIYEELTAKNSPYGTGFADVAAAKLKRLDAVSKAPDLAVIPAASQAFTAPATGPANVVPPMPTQFGPRLPGPIVIPSAATRPQ